MRARGVKRPRGGCRQQRKATRCAAGVPPPRLPARHVATTPHPCAVAMRQGYRVECAPLPPWSCPRPPRAGQAGAQHSQHTSAAEAGDAGRGRATWQPSPNLGEAGQVRRRDGPPNGCRSRRQTRGDAVRLLVTQVVSQYRYPPSTGGCRAPARVRRLTGLGSPSPKPRSDTPRHTERHTSREPSVSHFHTVLPALNPDPTR